MDHADALFVCAQAGERPPTGKLFGYTQTYLIFKDRAAPSTDHDGDGKEATEDQCEHEVLFRCGNWYVPRVQGGFSCGLCCFS
jgi:hypothetical protein